MGKKTILVPYTETKEVAGYYVFKNWDRKKVEELYRSQGISGIQIMCSESLETDTLNTISEQIRDIENWEEEEED